MLSGPMCICLAKVTEVGALLIHDTNSTGFLEAFESWLSRQATALNKPAPWKRASKKNSVWSCHCSELSLLWFCIPCDGTRNYWLPFVLWQGRENAFTHPARRWLSQWWSLLFPREIKWKAGRQAGSPTCFYDHSVWGGCYSTTNVRVRFGFHILWMQNKKNLQQKLRMYSFSPQNYEPVSESYF